MQDPTLKKGMAMPEKSLSKIERPPEIKESAERSLGLEKLPETPKAAEERPRIKTQQKTPLIDESNAQNASRARQKQIEKVMEENLEDLYLHLSPEEQKTFKIEGEQAAKSINDLFEKGKATIKRIIILLKKWFSFLPGVNKYFLEQEAKIKADKIMEMKNE